MVCAKRQHPVWHSELFGHKIVVHCVLNVVRVCYEILMRCSLLNEDLQQNVLIRSNCRHEYILEHIFNYDRYLGTPARII